MFVREVSRILASRLGERRRFIQAVVGPRQTGKTTAVLQAIRAAGRGAKGIPHHFAAADEPGSHDPAWLTAQWSVARALAVEHGKAVLVLDEVQNVAGWDHVVKARWDEDSRSARSVHLVLLGSAPLLVGRGLGESLAGRHETIHSTHWSPAELRKAFRFSWEDYVVFGGYPGAASLRDDPERWRRYLIDSIVETTLSRDILALVRVDKPALLRNLLHVAVTSTGSTISYTKLLGQLQDVGNTTTLAHYLQLLSAVGLVRGLQKFAGNAVRQRASSPRFQVMNTGLLTALSGLEAQKVLDDPVRRGLWTEAAIGAWLCAAERLEDVSLWTWRDGDHEVDFVVTLGDRVLAIEVKTGRPRGRPAGLSEFLRRYPESTPLIVDDGDGGGLSAEKFVSRPVRNWFA